MSNDPGIWIVPADAKSVQVAGSVTSVPRRAFTRLFGNPLAGQRPGLNDGEQFGWRVDGKGRAFETPCIARHNAITARPSRRLVNDCVLEI